MNRMTKTPFTPKGYEIHKRTGLSAIYRDGKHVGDHPRSGYTVTIHGRGTRLAGTALAAHALAEIELDVAPHRRRFVLTEEEYEAHVGSLRSYFDGIVERFPYTAEEAEAVAASDARYASVIEAGTETVRRKLLNVSPYEYVTWDPRSKQRPDFSEPSEEAHAQAM